MSVVIRNTPRFPQHPLETPWTFYYFQRSQSSNYSESNYEESIHKIGKVYTCEEFWNVYSHMLRPDKLPVSIALHLFRNDSRAMWEDPDNIMGGSFLLRVQKGQVKYLWERLILAMIGEQFSPDVNGAAVTIRSKVDLIYIWHRTAANEVVRMEICNDLMRELELPVKTKIDYSPFNDMINTSNPKTQIQYILEIDGPSMKMMTKAGRND